jgi:hypothetical protein
MKYPDTILQSNPTLPPLEADNAAIAKLQELAADYRAEEHDGDRLRVHLILRDQILADSLKRLPLTGEMADNVELYTYTTEDLWSMELLGLHPGSPTRLDRDPITPDCKQHVHLVIFGAGSQSESLAIHTALTAHYPNYCRDNTLRTRITMVADSLQDFHNFFQRYHNLLSNSYRRTVIAHNDEVKTTLLVPQYMGTRRDFVDVEWEFVEGRNSDPAILYKLQKWAHDEQQQLTIAICHDEDHRNLNEMLSLPSSVLASTPIWVRTADDQTISFLKQSKQYAQVVPFGMKSSPLPDLSAFIRMAQCVNYAYQQMREVTSESGNRNRADLAVALEPPTDQQLQELWNNPKLTTITRWSNIHNAFTLRTKMHSLGHTDKEWGTLFAISDKDTELLAEVEHNRWSVESLILGLRPTTEEEHTDIRQDLSLRSRLKSQNVHDDLRNFHELGVDDTGLPVTRYDMGLTRTLPLIAYSYHQLQPNKDE